MTMYTWEELIAVDGFIDFFLAILVLIVGLVTGQNPLEGVL